MLDNLLVILDTIIEGKPELKNDANNLKTIVNGYKNLKVTDEIKLEKIKTRVIDLLYNEKP